MRALFALTFSLYATDWVSQHTNLDRFSLATMFFFSFALVRNLLPAAARVGTRAWRVVGNRYGLCALGAGFALAVCSSYLSHYWTLCVLCGGVCLLTARLLPVKRSPDAPLVWNEAAIKQEIYRLRNNPTMLSGLTTALHERFIIRQNEQTARERIQFLKTALEGVKLTKELETSIDDLRFHEIERDIRQSRLELEKHSVHSEDEQRQGLKELQHRFEQLKLQLGIAKIEKDIAEIGKSGDDKGEPSEDEHRSAQRTYWEREIRRTQTEMKENLATIDDPEERVELENMYEDALRHKKEELRKYL